MRTAAQERGARIVHAREFRAPRAWGAESLVSIDGVTARLHWTDQPYHWHVNGGAEVFAVLDGTVDMHTRKDGREYLVTLCAGDIFCAEGGCEHIARPRGEARVLVVERAGSE